jgi:signal peptidase complex subunit 1
VVQVIAFLVGFFLQDITLTLLITLGGAALAFALVVPPWPFFNRHPVRWLPARNEALSQRIVVDGKFVG